MHLLKPPYSRKHIIILGALTFFVAILFLFWQKDAILNRITKPQPTVTIEELTEKHPEALSALQEGLTDQSLIRNNVILYDIRTPQKYIEQHLKGAEYLAIETIELSKFNPDTTLVLYSDNQQQAQAAQQAFAKINVTNIEIISEPLSELEKKGYQLASGTFEEIE